MGLDQRLFKKEINYKQIGIWRKANMIHNWFIQNVMDGKDDNAHFFYPVSKLQLAELLGVVKQVLRNHDLAEKLLPTSQGFFFGDQTYSEYYFADLVLTQDILEQALLVDDELFYQADW